MWLTAPNRIGIAAWRTGDSVWSLETKEGGRHGIQFLSDDAAISLDPSTGTFPVVNEQFVRGDELHLSFPQPHDNPASDNEFGFRLVVRPVSLDQLPFGSSRAVFELIVSVQTSLLDSHPTLDLVIPANSSEDVPLDRPDGSIQIASHERLRTAVLLGPQDAPFTSRIDSSGQLRLRLFGEFLEKGVIRRARPWLIIDRAGEEIAPSLAQSAWNALASSPLPLT